MVIPEHIEHIDCPKCAKHSIIRQMIERRMTMKKTLFIMVMMALFVGGCKYYYTEEAIGRDTLFSVERTKSGYYRVWFTHDDVSTYCTVDEELGKQAMNLLMEHDGEVLFRYNDSEWGDPEAGILNETKCGEGIYETKEWVLLELVPVEGR